MEPSQFIIILFMLIVLQLMVDNSWHVWVELQLLLTLGAHAQRGLQQSFCVCVCLSVCLSVCYPYSGKLSTKASYQRFQRLQLVKTKKIKKAISTKMFRSQVMAAFSQLSFQAYRGILRGKSSGLHFDDRDFYTCPKGYRLAQCYLEQHKERAVPEPLQSI